MIAGYLDQNDKNISVDQQRHILEQYATKKHYHIDMFLSATDIKNSEQLCFSSLHTLLIANIVCLGVSLRQIKDGIKFITDNGITLISIRENCRITPGFEAETLLKYLDLSIKFRSSLISITTGKVLAGKKDSGKKLGRKPGSSGSKKISEEKTAFIISRLLSGVSKGQTAKELGVSRVTLFKFIKKHSEITETIKKTFNIQET